MTRDKLLCNLHDLGFEAYIPRTSSWKYAFVSSNNTQTIYFLIGKRCIDFKFYDHVRATKVDEQGRIFTDGGIIVRNYYAGSGLSIHDLIIEIAKKFIENQVLDESFFSGHGISVREQNEEYKRSLPKSFIEEMKELYDDLCLGDGGDVYLSDGIWLSSSGFLCDKN